MGPAERVQMECLNMDGCNVTAVVRVIILKCLVRCRLVLSRLLYCQAMGCSECGKGDGGSTNEGGCCGSPERLLASEEELFFVDLVS